MATPTSIKVYQDFGVHRSLIVFAVYNHFVVPSELQECFDEYRLIEMPAQKFLDRMNFGQFHHEHRKYEIIFKGTSRGKIIARLVQNPDLVLKLSFRIVHPAFDISPVVMVVEKACKEN